MGYYTNYTIEIASGTPPENYLADIALHSGYQDLCEEPIKWYEHEKVLLEWTKNHPDLIIKLSGKGEEAEDLWVKYFKNGKVQRPKTIITYEEYDESKLTEE